MKSPRVRTHLVVALIVIISNKIRCIPVEDQGRVPGVRCDDIAEAIDYLYENFPAQMTLADKCKRYAVMASYVKPKVRLSSLSVYEVLRMPEDELNLCYQRLAAKNQLGALFMTAIDGFRAASLTGPPFVELIECLKQLDDPSIQIYLQDEELNTILTLYRAIQESPNTMIDLNLIPIFNRLRQGFVVSLMSMFEDNIQYDADLYQKLAGQQEPRKEDMIGMERNEIRKRERRRLAAHRHREQETLRSRRMRILSPVLPHPKDRPRRGRNSRVACDDIAEAIEYLHEQFPVQMTLADKCKRYAVIASFVRPKARVAKTVVHQFLNMTEDQLDQSFRSLAANNQLGELFMSAIDGFRAASLIGPAFLELVECLRLIRNHHVQKYLEDRELEIILGLYRLVLESPHTQIDLNCVPDLKKLRQGFVFSLMNLFKDNICYKPGSRRYSGHHSRSDVPRRPEGEMTESELWEMRRKERKRLAAHRLKEHDVLRARRMKILSSASIQETSRRRREHSSNEKCGDIAEAITHLYENLHSMTLVDKCKRYAVIISYLEPTGRLRKEAVSHVMRLSEDQLDQVYREIAASDQLGASYMTAIDGFRAASVLGPPFLELIECLKQLDNPSAQTYLDDEELAIIVELYRHVLTAPDASIDLNLIPFSSRLRYGFVVTLMNLFKDHIHNKPSLNQNSQRNSSASSSKQPVRNEVTESERREMRRNELKMLASHRNREKNALRARRARILSRSSSREDTPSRLELHQRVERTTELAIRSDPNGLAPSEHAPSSTFSAHQQQQDSLQQESPTHLPTTLLEPPRPILDVPVLITGGCSEVARSMAPAQAHQNQQSSIELSHSLPVAMDNPVASCFDPPRPDLQQQTSGVLFDRDIGYKQPQGGNTSRLEGTSAITRSLLPPASGAESSDNSDNFNVDDYLVSDIDTIDQSKPDDQ